MAFPYLLCIFPLIVSVYAIAPSEWPDAPEEVPTTITLKAGANWRGLCGGPSVVCNDVNLGGCSAQPYRRRLLDAVVDGGSITACRNLQPEGANDRRYFHRHEISPGQVIRFPHLFEHFTQVSQFLPHALATKIPFALEDLPHVLHTFAIQAPRLKLSMIATLQACTASPSPTETKSCVTSRQSMQDFVSRLLGPVQVVKSTVNTTSLYGQRFIIENVEEVVAPHSKHVACHVTAYSYLVYYCHMVRNTGMYRVTLSPHDRQTQAGLPIQAIVECHFETGFYDKSNPIFARLNASPGDEFCHFTAGTALLFKPAL